VRANGVYSASIQTQSTDFDKDFLNAQPFSNSDLTFDPAFRQSVESERPSQIDVRARVSAGSVGSRSVNDLPTIDANRALLDYGRSLSILAPLSVTATIAADRPQIYAIAATTEQQADRLGYNGYALALVYAAVRARALAHDLGVRTGALSIAAQYASAKWSASETVVSAGPGCTIDGESGASWRRTVEALAAAAQPRPGPSPARGYIMPVMVPTTYPSPRAAPSLMRDATTSGAQTDLVPLAVPDNPTLLTVQDADAVEAHADRLLMMIRVDSSTQNPPGLPAVSSIADALRVQPNVYEVDEQQQAPDALPVGFVIVTSTDTARSARLATLIRSHYARFHPILQYATSPLLDDCATPVEQGQRQSVEQATRKAASTSIQSGRSLRRLVLAALYPPQAGGACDRAAEHDAIDEARDETLHFPTDWTVRVTVPVKMVFRTASLPK
jgi:hypothetical protein